MEIGTTQSLKKKFNGLSSILDLKHFNMNLNDNVHQCEHFVMDF